MRTLATNLTALCGLIIVCGNWFYSNVIEYDSLDDLSGPVPPIRYDGDPTEIYLA